MPSVTIAQAGTAFPGSAFSSPIYRIPALGVTASGRILIAYDVRADWRDLPADFDIAVRHSDDGGKTWSAPRALRRHEPGHGFGDASFICAPDGTVWCWYVGSTGESFFSASPGGPGLELWLSYSTDNGLTWQHRDLSTLRPAEVGGMFAASGNGVATPDGILVQPFVARVEGRNYALSARSDDGGHTWRTGELVGPDCDENKIMYLNSGEFLLHARDTPVRRQARSADGLSFTAPVPMPGLTDPACNGGLASWGDVLVASMCDHPSERGRLSLHFSHDEGRVWGPPVLIDDGATAYSVIAPIDEDTLALAWEADDYESIQFATVSRGEEVTVRHGAGTWAKPPVVNPSGK